eukprot:2159448-Prymnesium_polylepis.3
MDVKELRSLLYAMYPDMPASFRVHVQALKLIHKSDNNKVCFEDFSVSIIEWRNFARENSNAKEGWAVAIRRASTRAVSLESRKLPRSGGNYLQAGSGGDHLQAGSGRREEIIF